MALMEGIAEGCLLIVSDISQLANFVRANTAISFTVEDSESLAQAVCSLNEPRVVQHLAEGRAAFARGASQVELQRRWAAELQQTLVRRN